MDIFGFLSFSSLPSPSFHLQFLLQTWTTRLRPFVDAEKEP